MTNPRSPSWLWLAVAAAVLAAFGNVVGLSAVDRVYGRETAVLLPQAISQDVVGLGVVAPGMVVLAVLLLRGRARVEALLLGALAFTLYNYAIYTLAIHVGPLFLLWTVVLGLAAYALISGFAAVDPEQVRRRGPGRSTVLAGWLLVVLGGLFTMLWLAEVVPSMLAGTVPRSAVELGLPANPVHVLDLSFFLPAAVIGGVLLLRDRPLGHVIGPAMLVFLLLTCLPILLTPVVSTVRGEPAAWGVVGPVGLVGVLCLVALVQLSRPRRRVPVPSAAGDVRH